MNRVSRRSYSTVLKYTEKVKNAAYGQLVNDTHDVTPLEDIETRSSRQRRLHPRTLMGKNGGEQHLTMPEELCEVVSETTKKYKNVQDLRQRTAKYYLELQDTGAHQPTKDKVDVDMHLNGVFLHAYASASNVLSELLRRMDSDWHPNSVLEVGFGPGTGMLALNELKKDWKPERKEVVTVGHPSMKKRAKDMLNAQKDEQTRVLQHVPAFNSRKYDLIIATHQLFRSDHHFPESVDDHASHLLSLLSEDGVLVLIERGDPRGFESIARARQIMFRPEDYEDTSKTPREWKTKVNGEPYLLKIVAPCPHHGKCPLQVGLDMRRKTKDPGFFNWCKFGQMVQRPTFTQELKKGQYLAAKWEKETPGKGAGGSHLSGHGRPFGLAYETASHSYLIVQRYKSAEQVLTPHDAWPRVLRMPMKRDKHVVMEVCAPSSHVEQWTVTKGHDKQAYHDARKSSGGDLWALGAKTVQVRGGNLKQLSRVEKAMSKTDKKSKIDEEKMFNDEMGNAIVGEAWNRAPGPGPGPAEGEMAAEPAHEEEEEEEGQEEESRSVDEYLAQLEKQFEAEYDTQREFRTARRREKKGDSKRRKHTGW